ncbi:hypothetical protein KY495_05685 [Massilia sp. PAMC28688]|uniref:hypothetical protein n=1 Tax=Massilia sp. PAMC28688 TaxID=2861283 RepID=UPI001C62D95D|nr:hypothetical protein [Massilia sp. PAMC28688]QYF94685.1 hypothetical protein KY495_05685 [Massilia sp. PAMC28688]
MTDLASENPDNHPDSEEEGALVQEARLWQGNGWTAKVIKNEEDEGWAVAMIRDGEPEPALVGPWTMGRDKKNPKPLDVNAFHTLVKTASEVIRRHEQQLQAILHKKLWVMVDDVEYKVTMEIVPDEEHPFAKLAAFNPDGDLVGSVRTSAGFKLTGTSAAKWIESGFRDPA